MRPAVRPMPVAAVVALTAALALTACSSSDRPDTSPAPRSTTTGSSRSSAVPSVPAPTTETPRADPAAVRHADARIAGLTGDLGRRGVSIAAVDTADGVTFGYGAQHGMLCASVAKLYILETLLLQHQDTGHPLGADRTLAAAMIENSDNDAANDLYVDIGEGAGLRHAASVLGLRNTTPGTGIYWGYTRTGATSYLALLRDLDGNGPLDRDSRQYALHLLSHVEPDQAWGVGSLGGGSPAYVKNGWLAVTTDGGRWAVNSVGIATVHGRRLLVVVMTQHGSSFGGGIELVDRLAHLAANVVTTR